MTSWLLWIVGTVAAIGGVWFTGWITGYNRQQKELFAANRKAEDMAAVAKAKQKEVEIYARPAGSKSDIVGRL